VTITGERAAVQNQYAHESNIPDPGDLHWWLQLYNLEDYLFDTVSTRFQADGTLNAYDFFAIVIWKSNRNKTKIREGITDTGESVGELMREVHQARMPEAKVEVLLPVQGIGISIASAILTVCYPKEFTVLDWRAWETLKEWEVEELSPRYPGKSEEYVQYCQACKRLAAQVELSLRDLDRALLGWSWEKGVRALCEKL